MTYLFDYTGFINNSEWLCLFTDYSDEKQVLLFLNFITKPIDKNQRSRVRPEEVSTLDQTEEHQKSRETALTLKSVIKLQASCDYATLVS